MTLKNKMYKGPCDVRSRAFQDVPATGSNTYNYSGTTDNYYEQKRLVYTRVVITTTKKTATIKLYKIP